MNNFIKEHIKKLKNYNISNPELELRFILNQCSLLNNKTVLLSNFNYKNINVSKFNLAFKRRLKYEPLSKIFNKKEFWSLNFYVNKNVLDPRPESEFLIEAVTKYFPEQDKKIRICDLGTGSGCLAITLAKLYKNSKILATEISQSAFKVAKKNIILHNVKNQIELINCNWISDQNFFDVIITNPPYLSKVEYDNCEENVKQFEPKTSLLGGIDGLDCYRQISAILNSIINENSFVFIEIGRFQKNKIKNIFNKNDLKLIKIIKDYQKIDRVLVFKKKKYEKNKKKLA
tara:strand:+ start:172 stop:1035 length:864 start_codon:yes stop_codon:yes gene_type:complete